MAVRPFFKGVKKPAWVKVWVKLWLDGVIVT